MDTLETNPYLVGNFAPVRDERDAAALDVTGAIPPELTGLLLRNGPNPVLDPDPALYHWFLGDGMLHGIELAGGAARYRNRWVRTTEACVALGEPPPPDAPPAVNGIGAKANTHVVAHAGRIYALVESSLPTEVRPDLSTVGAIDFDGRLTSAFTAHPKVDAVTGEMHFFGYDFLGEPFLRYHVVDASGALTRSEEIELPGPVMMHDFAITASSVVWLDLPVVFDVTTVGSRPFPFVWRPDHGARVGIMPRLGGNADVMWTEIEPCYVFHFLNAWEDDDAIIVDGCRSPRLMANFSDTPLTETCPPTLHRWRIDNGRATCEQLDDRTVDFPRTADSVVGRPNRFGYAAEGLFGPEIANFDRVVKYDLADGSTTRHHYGEHASSGEAVFAPDPAGTAEDDGWLLNFSTDLSTNTSEFVILDARDLAAGPVARIELPRRVPFGFHGNWMAGVIG